MVAFGDGQSGQDGLSGQSIESARSNLSWLSARTTLVGYRVWPAFSRLALLALLLTLAACSKTPLFSDLTEGEADQIVAVLLDKDIQCDKVAGKEGAWVVNIDKTDFPRAMALLDAEGLPADRFKSMGDIFQKSGLVSTPSEERIRFMYALSQELSQTIEKFDGVVTARVHIALSESDTSSETPRPASAAVFIKYRTGYDLESVKPDIKNLVAKSVEGLSYDNVTVMLVPMQPTLVASTTTAKTASAKTVWTSTQIIIVAALASIPLLLIIGFLIFRRRKSGGQSHGEKLHELANASR